MKEVALVVGGTSGIGKAQVKRLANVKSYKTQLLTFLLNFRWVKEGYEVAFCGRNEENGNKIAEENKGTYEK